MSMLESGQKKGSRHTGIGGFFTQNLWRMVDLRWNEEENGPQRVNVRGKGGGE
jgi:hypothetical protein